MTQTRSPFLAPAGTTAVRPCFVMQNRFSGMWSENIKKGKAAEVGHVAVDNIVGPFVPQDAAEFAPVAPRVAMAEAGNDPRSQADEIAVVGTLLVGARHEIHAEALAVKDP